MNPFCFKKIVRLLPFVAAGLFLMPGCSIFPTPAHTQTAYYDLAIPERAAAGHMIEVAQFSTMTAERYRMAERGADNRISGREFHKWVQTPGPLITKYLRLAFRNDAGAFTYDRSGKESDLFTVSGSVLIFEQEKNEAKLGLRYMISHGNPGEKDTAVRTILITEKMTGSGADAFAAAMSKAAWKASGLILSDIDKMAQDLRTKQKQ